MSLHDIAAAANELARVLEAVAPKGLRHPRHAQHLKPARAKIKAVMSHYFERQKRAVLAELKPRIKRALILHPNLKEASAQGKTFARSLVPVSLHPLTFAATDSEISEYNDAITELISAAAQSLGATAGADYASTYLRENSLSKLTGNLSQTSVERLQDAIGTAWEKKGGSYNDIVASITDTFEDFSDKRAGLIAQTEANDSYNAGRIAIAESLGYDEKRWDPDGEACPECQGNADQGWIDFDEDFASGDDAPTAHPNCDCSVDFRKSSEPNEEEE